MAYLFIWPQLYIHNVIHSKTFFFKYKYRRVMMWFFHQRLLKSLSPRFGTHTICYTVRALFHSRGVGGHPGIMCVRPAKSNGLISILISFSIWPLYLNIYTKLHSAIKRMRASFFGWFCWQSPEMRTVYIYIYIMHFDKNRRTKKKPCQAV